MRSNILRLTTANEFKEVYDCTGKRRRINGILERISLFRGRRVLFENNFVNAKGIYVIRWGPELMCFGALCNFQHRK